MAEKNEKKLKLSIIVPFYNVETYIEDCIRSLYKQDIPIDEYEVIAVDDCSPDNSAVVVERLQEEFRNLRLLSLPQNRKQGAARNAGLDIAKGKYILFVDSDDYLLPNVLDVLLEQIETDNLDMLEFDYVSDNNGKISRLIELPDIGVCKGVDLFFDKHFTWYRDHVVPWRKLYSRDFLESNALRFVENILYEDNDYALIVFAKAKRVRYINKCVYVYRNNPESFIRSKMTPQKFGFKIQTVSRVEHLRNELANIDNRFKKLIDEYVRNTLSSCFSTMKQEDAPKLFLAQITNNDWKIIRKYFTFKTYIKFRYLILLF